MLLATCYPNPNPGPNPNPSPSPSPSPNPNPNPNPSEVCTLDAEVVAGCGNFVDKNSMQYHCETEYFPPDADADGLPDRDATYGCASNDLTLAPILT